MAKTNNQLEQMYLNSYRDIERIVWNNKKKTTVVILKSGEKGIAKVQHGDKWNRELGFWVAYAKALQKGPPRIIPGSIFEQYKEISNYSIDLKKHANNQVLFKCTMSYLDACRFGLIS